MKLTTTRVKAFVLNDLRDAQKEFNKNPNSSNWVRLNKAMLVHQQVAWLRGQRLADNVPALMTALSALTIEEWPETIVRHTTGLSIDEMLSAA